MDGPDQPGHEDITTTFLRWTFSRAIFHRGYVLTSGLYFVLDAHLSGYQLLVLATIMSITLVLSDVPLGVWSDVFSRKWPLVIGHGFLAAGMVMTGLVTAFPLLVVTQVLWGLGWAFSTGADVAWVTDEFNKPGLIARVLTARARWDLMGGAIGMIAFGLLGWSVGLGRAIVVSGVAMALVGVYVAIGFVEDNFTRANVQKWKNSVVILQRGLSLSRRDNEVLVVLVATLIINGAAMISWVFPRQLIDQGFPSNPILWYTALGILSLGVGILALHVVEARIEGLGVARRTYALNLYRRVIGPGDTGLCTERRYRERRDIARERHLVQRHSDRERDLAEPAHAQQYPGHHALVPLASGISRGNHRWGCSCRSCGLLRNLLNHRCLSNPHWLCGSVGGQVKD